MRLPVPRIGARSLEVGVKVLAVAPDPSFGSQAKGVLTVAVLLPLVVFCRKPCPLCDKMPIVLSTIGRILNRANFWEAINETVLVPVFSVLWAQ
jgi:hypothetical protein